MISNLKRFILVVFLILFCIFSCCGLPEPMPPLELPISTTKTYSISSNGIYDSWNIQYVSSNKESYFEGYLFYYKDADGYLKNGYFLYYDTDNKSQIVSTIPLAGELADFLSIEEDIPFTFSIVESNYSSQFYENTVRNMYLLLDSDQEPISVNNSKNGTTIYLYLVPSGLDTSNRLFIFPAFSVTTNRVTLTFK
jgi:hypothetical protein